uniref:Methyltransferase domain-containing protein n=1 Tax=Plectus sambesii TaxID=2011161 RepID=A0A914X4B5_9BILA
MQMSSRQERVIFICAFIVLLVVFDVRINISHLTKSAVSVACNLTGVFNGWTNDSTTTEKQKNEASLSASIVTIDPLVKGVFEQQQAARQAAIANNLIALPPGTTESPYSLTVLYNGLDTEVPCGRLVRIGNVNDGGKWLCDPWSLPTNCIVYSFGVGGDNTFEKELAQLHQPPCSIWSFDNNPEYANLFVGLNQSTFRPWLIGRTTNINANVYTPHDIMKQFGSEYNVLPELLAKFTATNTTFCQVLVEMHGLGRSQTQLLQKFAKADYLMYSYEINGAVHTACEYSFIHRPCMNQYGMYEVLQRNFAPQ